MEYDDKTRVWFVVTVLIMFLVSWLIASLLTVRAVRSRGNWVVSDRLSARLIWSLL